MDWPGTHLKTLLYDNQIHGKVAGKQRRKLSALFKQNRKALLSFKHTVLELFFECTHLTKMKTGLMLDANIPSRSEKSLEEICRPCAGDYAEIRVRVGPPRDASDAASHVVQQQHPYCERVDEIHNSLALTLDSLSTPQLSALCFIWVMLIQHWPYFQYSHTAAALVEMCAQCVINTHGGGGGGRRRLSRNGKILTPVPELGFAPNKYTLRACVYLA